MPQDCPEVRLTPIEESFAKARLSWVAPQSAWPPCSGFAAWPAGPLRILQFPVGLAGAKDQIAFLWSIHQPTLVFIDLLVCLSLLPAALPHAPLADLPKMVAAEREDDGLGDEPGAPELGPKQELPVVKPSVAHEAEPIE